MHWVTTNASSEYSGAKKNLRNLDAFLHKTKQEHPQSFYSSKRETRIFELDYL
jgi:hypothetical protein